MADASLVCRFRKLVPEIGKHQTPRLGFCRGLDEVWHARSQSSSGCDHGAKAFQGLGGEGRVRSRRFLRRRGRRQALASRRKPKSRPRHLDSP